MEYRKTYKLFVLWIIGFLLIVFAIALQDWDDDLLARAVSLCGALGVVGLSLMVYRTGYVYWINGISYEEALEAGEERRKQYAWNHVSIFSKFALFYLLYTMLACFFHWSIWIDIPIFLIGIIISAVWTSKYKL